MNIFFHYLEKAKEVFEADVICGLERVALTITVFSKIRPTRTGSGNESHQLEALLSFVSHVSMRGQYSAPSSVRLSIHLSVFAYDLHTSAYNLIIQRSPSPAITPANSKHSGATGKQHYLRPYPSHGVRQLQTLHVTPPCHPHHAHTSAHTLGDTHPSGLKPPCTRSHYFISPLPSPSLSACHSLSLALCKIALRRAATVLRNSVIYWQFPP